MCRMCLRICLNNITQTCKQSIKISFKEKSGLSNCFTKNIGTKQNPIYSSDRYYSPFDLLVYSESGINFCLTSPDESYEDNSKNNIYELEGCTEATVDTTYLTNLYNCIDCKLGNIPYNSKYFKRKICQNIYENIIRIKDFDSEAFIGVEKVSLVNGTCFGKKLFTPDNKTRYTCNNRAMEWSDIKAHVHFQEKLIKI